MFPIHRIGATLVEGTEQVFVEPLLACQRCCRRISCYRSGIVLDDPLDPFQHNDSIISKYWNKPHFFSAFGWFAFNCKQWHSRRVAKCDVLQGTCKQPFGARHMLHILLPAAWNDFKGEVPSHAVVWLPAKPSTWPPSSYATACRLLFVQM